VKFVPRALSATADVSRGKQKWQDWLKGLIGLLVFGGIAWFILGLISDYAAESISESQEAKMFTWLKESPTPAEQPYRDRAEPIFEKLLAAGDLRPLPFYFSVSPAHEYGPNAFAWPGGGVGVTPELFDLVKTEIGLAFVLAHELGHHEHRHTLKRLSRGLLWGLIASLAGSAEPTTGSSFLHLGMLANSRAQEAEADAFAMALVHQAYGTTNGASEFFEIMQAKDGWAFSSFHRTHPLSGDRLEFIQDWIP